MFLFLAFKPASRMGQKVKDQLRHVPETVARVRLSKQIRSNKPIIRFFLQITFVPYSVSLHSIYSVLDVTACTKVNVNCETTHRDFYYHPLFQKRFIKSLAHLFHSLGYRDRRGRHVAFFACFVIYRLKYE